MVAIAAFGIPQLIYLSLKACQEVIAGCVNVAGNLVTCDTRRVECHTREPGAMGAIARLPGGTTAGGLCCLSSLSQRMSRCVSALASNYVFKPTAEEVARIIQTSSRGGGLTRRYAS